MRSRLVAQGAALVLALVPVVAAAAPPPEDVDDLVADSTGEAVVKRRLAAIRRLAEADNQGAAVGLARVVRHAPDGRLREAAARGLARMDTARAAPLLVELVAHGNTRDVRRELGDGISLQRDGVERVLRRLASRSSNDDALGRRLLVASLGEDPGPDARKALERLALGDDADLRITALRALSMQSEGRSLSRALAGIVLEMHGDPDTRVLALDLLVDAPLDVLAEHEEQARELAAEGTPPVQRRAQLLLDRATYLREKAERDEVRDTRYAKSGTDPEEPRMAARPVDVIFAVETTFSAASRLRRRKGEIADRIHALLQRGLDLRVGVIAYRDHLRDENQRRTGYTTRELPLTHDTEAAIAWLNSLGAGGVDTQGLAISSTLHEGFARMNWRWDASREFHLIAGRLIDRPKDAARTAGLHVTSDRTALFFYGSRSRQNLAFAKSAGIDVGTWQ